MSVVVCASSGGGTATLGHTNPIDLLQAIQDELGRIETSKSNPKHGIKYAVFISSQASMDSVDANKDMATLWTVGVGEETSQQQKNNSDSSFLQVRPYYTGLLKDVNNVAKEIEKTIIAPAILDPDTSIQGMISISSDPKAVNYESFAAATKCKIPVTGSGGTSLSAAAAVHDGIRIVAGGGSVASTTYTRAVSFASALADAWSEKYNPFQGGQHVVKPKLGSILDSCLPSFLAVCIISRVLKMFVSAPTFDLHENELMPTATLSLELILMLLQHQALPSVCAVVTATSLSPEHGSTAVMAAVVASMSSWNSILSGLFAGWLVSFLIGRALFMCIRHSFPTTMTNIIAAGFVGPFVAIIFYMFGVAGFLSTITDWVRMSVRTSHQIIPGYGFLLGCIFCYGSKIGWYHKVFLPVILMEMERGEASIWGAVDECTLVLVSCGICAANALFTDDTLPRRGLKINIFCGDFIEVAYPFMEKSKIVNVMAYLASGVSTAILYSDSPHFVLSSAYLPIPLCIFLAKDQTRISLAMTSAFLLSFLGMSVSIIFDRMKKKKK